MTDEEFLKLDRRQANSFLSSLKDRVEYKRLYTLYISVNERQKTSGMLSFGRVLFFLSLLIGIMLFGFGVPPTEGVNIFWVLCYAMNGMGVIMWMLGAIEERLLEILYVLQKQRT